MHWTAHIRSRLLRAIGVGLVCGPGLGGCSTPVAPPQSDVQQPIDDARPADRSPDALADPNVSLVTWVDGDARFVSQWSTLPPLTGTPGAGQRIDFDAEKAFQTMYGFGAAMTHSSARLFSQLSPSDRASVFRRLFGEEDEAAAGINLLRLTMGSSDFSLVDYTYDELADVNGRDMEMAKFSIDADREYYLPVLKEAHAVNPELRFVSTPWTPPRWMKTSKSYGDGWIQSDQMLAPYAKYFRKYIDAYQAEGLPILAVTLQNEPGFATRDYASMRMHPYTQSTFVRDHLGPLLQGSGVKILIWDHNWDLLFKDEWNRETPNAPQLTLQDERTRPYVAGAAFHCYAGQVSQQSVIKQAFPDQEIFFTECSGGSWATDRRQNLLWNGTTLLVGAIRNHASTVLFWNLALNRDHDKDPNGGKDNGPKKKGGCPDCRGLLWIDPSVPLAEAFNEELYAIRHLSRFVRRGALRVSTEGDGPVQHVGFLNPGSGRVLVAVNPTAEEQPLQIVDGSRTLGVRLPPQALASYRWR